MDCGLPSEHNIDTLPLIECELPIGEITSANLNDAFSGTAAPCTATNRLMDDLRIAIIQSATQFKNSSF